MGGALALERVPRRRGDRVHARDRAGARGLRGRPRASGALRAARTRAADRPPLRGRLARRRCRSGTFGPATCCSSSTARSCRSTACWSRASACFDESALTGESRPVERSEGEQVRSGAVNAGAAFDLRAAASADQSTYAGIVRLVEQAQKEKAPFVRLADRYAMIFIPVTLGDRGRSRGRSAATRCGRLSVLVVATPCPLILAAPIAIVAGISRAAKRGIIVKGGGALEALARGRVLLFDKTGTLTTGTPEVAEIDGVRRSRSRRGAAARRRRSTRSRRTCSRRRSSRRRAIAGSSSSFPQDVSEELGSGIRGTVEGRSVALGKASWIAHGEPLPAAARDVRRRSAMEGSSCVFVSVDGADRRRAGPRRPDPPRHAEGDPDAPPSGDRTRRDGDRRPPGRRRVRRDLRSASTGSCPSATRPTRWTR